MISIQKAQELAQSTLSAGRYRHTLCVRDAAVALAEKYGADTKKAELAALLHDIAKEMDKTELLRIISTDDIIANNCQKRPKVVWHAVAAAVIAKRDLGVNDDEIINAIASHTTGRKGMTRLDKIIYMADMISADRNYPELQALRETTWQSLDKGTAEGLYQSLLFIKQKGKAIDELTVAAYDELKHYLEA